MICRLRGMVRERAESHVVLDVQGVSYHVLIPPAIMQQLEEKLESSSDLELVTYHYQQLDVGKGFSILIGFLNEIEREFFERFITVSGVGPKAALRALTQPIPVIARAIDEGNLSLLKSLPGIGEQRAKEIVAKLQGKIGKFALIQTKSDAALPPAAAEPAAIIEEEALAILAQLEYTKPEAKEMIKAALARNPRLKTAEELLNEVYRQRLGEPPASAAASKPARDRLQEQPA
ncbi:MAG: hypothetical protein HYY15_01125 [Candidatus Omnitrophica bacterium]|nr:hypothetical protein [Candidatus Omnitrophota bacterium]